MYSIELDCPPGSLRPGDLLPGVLEGTGIEPEQLQLISTFFGNWTWRVPQECEAQYGLNQDKVKARITALYYAGRIRYGSW